MIAHSRTVVARRHLALRRGPAPGAVISDINITPLIDVMLVLLVMLILTIPIMTHKVPVELPQGNGTAAEREVHNLTVDPAGRHFWDGRELSRDQVGRQLAAMARRQPEALLHFDVSPSTRYDLFAHDIAMIKRSGVTKVAFIGLRKPEDW
ncbi:MAG: biopolymer transporter ExbD [Blastomonas sp.]